LTPPAVPNRAVDPVVEALRAGLVVAVPTDTVYGLAVDPALAGSTARLFAAKGRPDAVPLPVLVPDVETADRLARRLDGPGRRLAERYWPGPLTMVLDRSAAAASFELGGDGSTIGLRCPGHPLLLALLQQTGPLAVTSANRHGEPPLTEPASVAATFGDAVAALLDGGTCAGTPSTVVRVGAEGLQLLRAGAIAFDELAATAAG
jgi:tRNA threonylcarbamoyl adenosine modification protein (Sua5/YciO/YrdC/YwlC family)